MYQRKKKRVCTCTREEEKMTMNAPTPEKDKVTLDAHVPEKGKGTLHLYQRTNKYIPVPGKEKATFVPVPEDEINGVPPLCRFQWTWQAGLGFCLHDLL